MWIRKQPALGRSCEICEKELKKREENTKQLSTIHAHHILRTVLLHPVLRLQSETFYFEQGSRMIILGRTSFPVGYQRLTPAASRLAARGVD